VFPAVIYFIEWKKYVLIASNTRTLHSDHPNRKTPVSTVIKIVIPILVYNYRKRECWSYLRIMRYMATASTRNVDV